MHVALRLRVATIAARCVGLQAVLGASPEPPPRLRRPSGRSNIPGRMVGVHRAAFSFQRPRSCQATAADLTLPRAGCALRAHRARLHLVRAFLLGILA